MSEHPPKKNKKEKKKKLTSFADLAEIKKEIKTVPFDEKKAAKVALADEQKLLNFLEKEKQDKLRTDLPKVEKEEFFSAVVEGVERGIEEESTQISKSDKLDAEFKARQEFGPLFPAKPNVKKNIYDAHISGEYQKKILKHNYKLNCKLAKNLKIEKKENSPKDEIRFITELPGATFTDQLNDLMVERNLTEKNISLINEIYQRNADDIASRYNFELTPIDEQNRADEFFALESWRDQENTKIVQAIKKQAKIDTEKTSPISRPKNKAGVLGKQFGGPTLTKKLSEIRYRAENLEKEERGKSENNSLSIEENKAELKQSDKINKTEQVNNQRAENKD